MSARRRVSRGIAARLGRRRRSARLRSMSVGLRVAWLRAMSDNPGAFEGSRVISPVLSTGKGTIRAEGATLGYFPSPGLVDGSIHIEARNPTSSVVLERGVALNNAAVLISEGEGITIGEGTLIGPELFVAESDFHALDPTDRIGGPIATAAVRVGRNVFLGARVTITKGVTIGDDSVIGAGSVVTSDIPAGCIAAGNPCRVIRRLDDLA